MAFRKAIWDQLKNTTADRLIRALTADCWEEDVRRGATLAFRKGSGKRVVIHYHPKKGNYPFNLTFLLGGIAMNSDHGLTIDISEEFLKKYNVGGTFTKRNSQKTAVRASQLLAEAVQRLQNTAIDSCFRLRESESRRIACAPPFRRKPRF